MESENRVALGDLEDNDLANGTMAVVDQIRPHLGTILLVVLTLFASLAIWTLVRSQQAAQRTAGWDACLAALAEGDQVRLEEIVGRYGGSTAAQWAELVLADTALADGNRLLAIDAARGRRRLEEAVGRYTTVNAQRPKQLAAERGVLGLARARESLGELAEARRGYEALVEEYPTSPFRPLAEERIAALGRESTAEWYKWFESRSAAAATPAAEAGAAAEPKPESVTDEPSGQREPATQQEPAQRGEPAQPAGSGEPAAPPAG